MPKLSEKTKTLFADMLQTISPKEETRKKVLSLVQRFLAELNAKLKKHKFRAKAVLGGSYAKDTWLEGDYDVDIFVLFGLSHKKDNISDLLHKALEDWNPKRIRGSRDYFHLKKQVLYEIIPALAITSPKQAENTTDFSSKHVDWVKKRSRKLTNDIRMFKKFCKANKVYGAESYIKGISGHVADLIVIYYKGFWNAVCAISKWKPKVIIDIEKTYKTNPLLVLNANKTSGPLVIIDPVQPERNAAAALSQETFNALVKVSGAFTKKPTKKYFEEKITDLKKLAKTGCLEVIKCTPLADPQDIAGTKILKVFEYIKKSFADFGVKKSGWQWNGKDDAELWFVLKKKNLPEKAIIQGPPLVLTRHVAKFKKAHPDVFAKATKRFVYANIKREITTPEQLLKKLSHDQYITTRVNSCKLQPKP